MSTNVYNYEERWGTGNPPHRYYGWVITTSSDSMRVAHFENKKKRQEMEKAIKNLLPDFVDHVLVTACLAIKRWGEERDYEFADHLLEEEFEKEKIELNPERDDKLAEIVDKFV